MRFLCLFNDALLTTSVDIASNKRQIMEDMEISNHALF
jgi:hypothetical protein